MSDAVIVAVIAAVSSLLLAVVNFILAALKTKRERKHNTQDDIAEIKAGIAEMKAEMKQLKAQSDKNEKHNELQYMSLLRLTIMDSDMPMSERLIAGKEYIGKGGNGDVKEYYHRLEESVNG